MSTFQPIRRRRVPAKSPPSDPPTIRARRLLEFLLFFHGMDSVSMSDQAAEQGASRLAASMMA